MRRLLPLLSGWLLLSSGILPGQFLSPEQLNPFRAHRDGIQVYGVSVFTTYLSGVPGYLTTGNSAASYEFGVGCSADIGWNRVRERSSMSVQYGFLYGNQTGASGYRTLSHRLSLAASRRIGYRWNLSFSADAQILNSADLMFMQGALTQALDVPSSFADLTAGVLAGRLTSNNDIAAMLTRSYAYTGPAQTLFLGDRMFNSTAQTRLSYHYSPRLIFHVDGSVARSQALDSQTNQNSASSYYRIPQFTTVTAQTGLSYSLSPRTTVGLDLSSQRGVTLLQDAYTNSALVSLGRVMGRRWFVNLRAGASIISPVHTTYQVTRSPQLVQSGLLGYKTSTYTLALSADRSVVDSYGLGPSYLLNTVATWSWRRPGRSWAILAAFGQQRVSSTIFPELVTWQATGTYSRTLMRQTIVSVSYGYLYTTQGPVILPYTPASHGVRVMFRWVPGGSGVVSQ